MEQRNHNRKPRRRLHTRRDASARPTLLFRRRGRTQARRAVGVGRTFNPCGGRAVIDVAPERVQIGDVVGAGTGSSSGVVGKDLSACTALGHDCSAVGA